MRRCRNVADGELYALCLLGISPRETANRIRANASTVSDTVARRVGATDAVGTQAKVQRGTYRALGVAGAAPYQWRFAMLETSKCAPAGGRESWLCK